MNSTLKLVQSDAASPQLIIQLDRKRIFRQPISGLDTGALNAVFVGVCASDAPVMIAVTDFYAWPDVLRWELLTRLKSLGSRASFTVDGRAGGDVFATILDALATPRDLTGQQQAIKAAIEAAALWHGDLPELAANAIANRMQECRLPRRSVRALQNDIRALAGDSAVDDGGPRRPDPTEAARYFLQHRTGAQSDTASDLPLLRYWRGDWFEWTGHRYATVSDDALAAELTRFLQARGYSATGKFVSDVLVNLRGMAHLNGEAGVLPPFRMEPESRRVHPANVIVFSNGMVDLDQLDLDRSLKVAPHDPSIFATSELPYEFDAQATCPRWRKFLGEILPKTADNDRRQRVLQEFFGYTLLRDCRFERMLLMVGAGRNGKSTIMNVWDAMLGVANVSNVPLDRLGSDAHLLELVGKLANFSRDLNHLSRNDEGRIKQLVSGEPITADRKYKSALTSVTRAKLIVACNELPDFSDPSLGIWRRMDILPFDVVVDESAVDVHLAAALRAELPGILNWALRGLQRLLRRNRFTTCARCVNAVATHRQNSCSVRAFFAACCVRSTQHECLATNVYQLYRVWCQATGRLPVRDSTFGRRFIPLTGGRYRGVREGNVARPWVYRAVRLSPDAAPFANRLVAHPMGISRVDRPLPAPTSN